MIRLVTVIGHGINLLPHFIEHYEKQVDEINIVIYESGISMELAHDIREIVRGNKKIKIVKTVRHRIFDWEKVTQLYNEIKSTYPNDWWVVADIDEFHLYPYDNLRAMIKNCDVYGWDLVRGGFIDRIGKNGEFVDISSDNILFQQFPEAGFFRYPMSKACPNKVCVMKGYVEITSGQHYAKIDGHTTWRWQGWNHPLIAPYDEYSVQVHHFKWDKTSIQRMLDVCNVNEEYAFSQEYRTMYYAIREINFKIDIYNKEYMFEVVDEPKYNKYKQWNKLINKIVSI